MEGLPKILPPLIKYDFNSIGSTVGADHQASQVIICSNRRVSLLCMCVQDSSSSGDSEMHSLTAT